MLTATLLCILFLILLLRLIFSNFLIQVSSRSPKDGSYYKRIPKSSAIKVIDFGSTTYDRQNQTYVVSTRHYRAPEVILGKVFKHLGFLHCSCIHEASNSPYLFQVLDGPTLVIYGVLAVSLLNFVR